MIDHAVNFLLTILNVVVVHTHTHTQGQTHTPTQSEGGAFNGALVNPAHFLLIFVAELALTHPQLDSGSPLADAT